MISRELEPYQTVVGFFIGVILPLTGEIAKYGEKSEIDNK
jgi:hypothetical protein